MKENFQSVRRLELLKRRQKFVGRLVEKAEEDLAVHIIAQGPERLHILMVKNAHGDGLSQQEYKEANIMIGGLPLGATDCWVCDTRPKNKAILGLGICRGHAGYALATRK